MYEAWAMAGECGGSFDALSIRAGHGLLGRRCFLDDSRRGLVVDRTLPASSAKLHAALTQAWPRLSGRVVFVAGSLDDVTLLRTDVVVSSHACGALTDRVLEGAVAARARVAVLPCCHVVAAGDTGELSGWVDGPMAIDIVRAMRLKQQGYRIWTQAISAGVTPKNACLAVLTQRPN